MTCLQKEMAVARPGGVVDIQVGGTACDNGLAGNGRQRVQRHLCTGILYIPVRSGTVTGDGPGTGVRQ